MKITKAIIPVASYGTRMRPWTNYLPKELLPVVDTPALEIVVQEAVEAGIEQILFIVLEEMKDIFRPIIGRLVCEYSFHANTTIQGPQRGTAHAISYIKPILEKDEPFVVILADTLLEYNPDFPPLEEMIRVYKEYGKSVILLEKIEPELIERFGVAEIKRDISLRIKYIAYLTEKPERDKLPSNLAIIGRYVLDYEIFEIIKNLNPNEHNEICLTDALKQLAISNRLLGYEYEGKSWDIGNKLDFLETNCHFGLKHPETKKEFIRWLFPPPTSIK